MTTLMKTTGSAWRLAMWGLIAALLLLPWIAMQFTHEMAWDAADFAFAGVLLIGAGLIFELAAWRTRKLVWRLAIGGALVFGVLLIWADAAVGVF
ncbi:hypothetical protein D3C71_528880 [compost metagenome]